MSERILQTRHQRIRLLLTPQQVRSCSAVQRTKARPAWIMGNAGTARGSAAYAHTNRHRCVRTLTGGRDMTPADEVRSPRTFDATQRYHFGIRNTKHASEALRAYCITSVQTSEFPPCLVHTVRRVFVLTLHTVQWAGGVYM